MWKFYLYLKYKRFTIGRKAKNSINSNMKKVLAITRTFFYFIKLDKANSAVG